MSSLPNAPRWLPPSPEPAGGRWFFAGILLIAAAVRLWRLDTPSLWFDEVLVAMVAKYPVHTIVSRAFVEDIHPPLFHLLTKLVMHLGRSDTILRLPSALFGLAGVWLAWRAGKSLLSTSAGLAWAAAVAISPWHVLLSRQLRPYAIIFFFCLLALYFLIRACRDGRRRDVLVVALAFWPPMLLYYGTLLPIGGAFCVLLLAAAARKLAFRSVALYALAVAIPVASVLPFLWACLGHEQNVTGGKGWLEMALLCLERSSGLLFRENLLWARLGLSFLALAGLGGLLWRRREVALVSLGWVLFPLTTLVLARYGTYFNPWHLMFLLPAATLWLGEAIRLAAGRFAPAAALCLCLAGAVGYFTSGDRFYYQEASNGGWSKPMARVVLAEHREGDVQLFSEGGISGPLNWYLDQSAGPNPLRAQPLDAEPGIARLSMVAVDPGLMRVAEAPDMPLGPEFSPVKEMHWDVVRTPVTTIAALPFQSHITADPLDFYARVWRLDGAACRPVLEHSLIATSNDRPGTAEFHFDNQAGIASQRVTVHFGYDNRMAGNSFRVFWRFDDEPWQRGFESLGQDQRGYDKIVLGRDSPYHTFAVRFELTCGTAAPAYIGENLDTLRFIDFKVIAEVDRDAEAR